MRKLVVILVVLAALAVGLGFADVAVRHRVETTIAQRIEASDPGTTATVRISSWPFVGHLLASGTVPALRAHVVGVRAGPFPVDSVDLSVQDISLSRSDLLHGRVVLRSIRTATATAALSQQSIDTGTGLPVTLGAGTVGLGGVQIPARLSIVSGDLRIDISPLPTISIPLLPSSLLPCSASAVITTGELTLSCTTTTIPPSLLGTAG